MTDAIYNNVLKHFEEVTSLPPQKLGRLTPLYKEVTKRLKVMPWFVWGMLSIVLVFAMYLRFGSTLTFLVSTLQRGF